MEETTPVVEAQPVVQAETAAPVVTTAPETAAAPDPREAFFQKAREIGIDASDDDGLLGHVTKLQGELERYKSEYSSMESKVNSMPPALMEVAAMLVADGFKGTEKELMRKTIDYLDRNSTDYSALAQENPERVLREQMRSSNPAYTDAQLDQAMARKRKAYEREAADEGLESDEAAKYVKDQMALDATAHVPALEAKKAQLRFRPEGLAEPQTPEQQREQQRVAQEANNRATIEAASKFTGIDLGEAGKWDIGLFDDKGAVKQEFIPVLNEIATGKWFERFLNSDGTPNRAAMLEYEMYRQQSSVAASRRVADAKGLGAHETVVTMRNPSLDGGGGNPGTEGSPLTYLDAFKQFHSRQPQ